MLQRKIIFLVGPTAIGKTETAIHLTRKLNAEIISCDSMQIYKGMDIITSKPSRLQKKIVPQHLINIIPATKEYNVSKYRKDALRKIKEILRRGKLPLFVGGSGLYMSILVDGIFSLGAKVKAIRSKLYKQAKVYGNQFLYQSLKKNDPQAAKKIHPNDTKRIIRALEVFESTGSPISQLQKERKGLKSEYDVVIFCLNLQRDKLYKRIDERVEKMFKQGLVSEVKRLLKLKLSKTASYAIGIKELKGYFAGLYGLEQAKQMIKRNTHTFAKRQLTWFRKEKRINWINIKDTQTPREIAKRIWKKLY